MSTTPAGTSPPKLLPLSADAGNGGVAPRGRETYVFDVAESRRGYPINKLCASFRSPQQRERFSADEAAYCDEYGLSAEHRRAVLARDWVTMLDLGGSIFYIFKLAQLDGRSMQYLGGTFTGTTAEEFAAQMRAGGRSYG